MKLYHISRQDLGESVILTPKIPKHKAFGENNSLPRICCAPSVYNCLISIEAAADIENNAINLYVYSTEANSSMVYYPEPDEVPDVFYTNEVWLLGECEFYKEYNATLNIHMNIPNSPYSRYVFTREGCEDVLDRIGAMPVYGDLGSFSYIDFNAHRLPQAIQYAEQHREEYEC